ncbi:MAG: hypothetical protein NTV86_00690 [Planctomycetota bacterium]|nr:hypothetical protein [Planctomycetota bacterium]
MKPVVVIILSNGVEAVIADPPYGGEHRQEGGRAKTVLDILKALVIQRKGGQK